MSPWLTVAIVVAHAFFQAAGAQGDGQPAGDSVAEELRQIREQMEEARHDSEALFWLSFLVGVVVALVAVAGTACSIVYLRRHVILISSDTRERLRPALARTECHVRRVGKAGSEASREYVMFEITNVGEVAAVEIEGSTKFGESADSAVEIILPIGAISPHSSKMIGITIDPNWDPGHGKPFRFEINLEYKAIGGRRFAYHATGVLHGKEILCKSRPYRQQAIVLRITSAMAGADRVMPAEVRTCQGLKPRRCGKVWSLFIGLVWSSRGALLSWGAGQERLEIP